MRVALVVFVLVLLICQNAAISAELLANRTLRAGTVLGSHDVTIEGDPSDASLSNFVGLETRRIIFAGQPIDLQDLGPPTLVHRNDIVTLLYRSGVIDLRSEARALSAGGLGERIAVMNVDSRQTIQVVIVGPNVVEARR